MPAILLISQIYSTTNCEIACKKHLVVSLRNHPSGVKEKRRGGKGAGDSISRKRYTAKCIFSTRGQDYKNSVLQKSA